MQDNVDYDIYLKQKQGWDKENEGSSVDDKSMNPAVLHLDF